MAADDDLLEVEHLRADVGDRVEEGFGDAGSVLTRDGHEERLRGHVGHLATPSTPLSEAAGSLAIRPMTTARRVPATLQQGIVKNPYEYG